jgi:hypothetical protein
MPHGGGWVQKSGQTADHHFCFLSHRNAHSGSVGLELPMVSSLRYILPLIVLLGFGGWLFSDQVQKPHITSAIQGRQQTLLQLQKEIRDLQSSVKELARNAKKAKDPRPAVTQPAKASTESGLAW